LGIESEPDSRVKLPLKVFISHGHGEGALLKLERFIRELDVEPIIVKDQPNADRTVDDKVLDYLKDVDFVIIFATGDDVIKGKDIIQPRQNVIHEIGLAQTTHPGKIIYLLEGKAQFPSNINPKVYYRFERNSMDDAFTGIVREMRNWGYLKVGK
jgi:predicted nucleotide-binding protein